MLWEEFRPALERVWERVWRKPDAERKFRAGRKPMDAVLMFKTLVQSALYNLSDEPQAEQDGWRNHQITKGVEQRVSGSQILALRQRRSPAPQTTAP